MLLFYFDLTKLTIEDVFPKSLFDSILRHGFTTNYSEDEGLCYKESSHQEPVDIFAEVFNAPIITQVIYGSRTYSKSKR